MRRCQPVRQKNFPGLDVARQQQARSLELRAATSLARLRGKHGRRAQAHDLLAPGYGSFTEGFDIADLKEAKVLIRLAPQLKVLLTPYPAEEMVAWPVSPRVGNVKNNDPSLIEPITGGGQVLQ